MSSRSQSGSSRCSATPTAVPRSAWSGNEFIARSVLGDAEDKYLTFVDPDAAFVQSLGLTHLPAFVHLRQDTTLVASAEGWDPERVATSGQGSGEVHGVDATRRWPGPGIPHRRPAGLFDSRTTPHARHLDPGLRTPLGCVDSGRTSCDVRLCCSPAISVDHHVSQARTTAATHRSPYMKKRAMQLLMLALAVTTVGSLLVPRFAPAAPIDDKQAEAAQLEQQINDNGRRIDALNEQINSAQIALDEANNDHRDRRTRRLPRPTVEDQGPARRARATRGLGLRAVRFGRWRRRSRREEHHRPRGRGASTRRSPRSARSRLVNQLADAKEELAARKADAEAARAVAEKTQAQIEATKADLAAGDTKQRALLVAGEGRHRRSRREAGSGATRRRRSCRSGEGRGGSGRAEQRGTATATQRRNSNRRR